MTFGLKNRCRVAYSRSRPAEHQRQADEHAEDTRARRGVQARARRGRRAARRGRRRRRRSRAPGEVVGVGRLHAVGRPSAASSPFHEPRPALGARRAPGQRAARPPPARPRRPRGTAGRAGSPWSRRRRSAPGRAARTPRRPAATSGGGRRRGRARRPPPAPRRGRRASRRGASRSGRTCAESATWNARITGASSSAPSIAAARTRGVGAARATAARRAARIAGQERPSPLQQGDGLRVGGSGGEQRRQLREGQADDEPLAGAGRGDHGVVAGRLLDDRARDDLGAAPATRAPGRRRRARTGRWCRGRGSMSSPVVHERDGLGARGAPAGAASRRRGRSTPPRSARPCGCASSARPRGAASPCPATRGARRRARSAAGARWTAGAASGRRWAAAPPRWPLNVGPGPRARAASVVTS